LITQYEWYLFDLDGTLIDTVELIFQCFSYTLRRFGAISAGREKVILHIGMPLRDQYRVYFAERSDEFFERIMAAHLHYQSRIYPEYLRLFPDVADALERLHGRGCRLGIVSSRRRESSLEYLRELGIGRFFDCVVGPESTSFHKPHPEPVLKALELLGAAAGGTLFTGDSSFDIESGAAAGTDTAFVRRGHVHVSSLRVAPTYVLDSLQELCGE
jgi:pyrophosphatase PpaX